MIKDEDRVLRWVLYLVTAYFVLAVLVATAGVLGFIPDSFGRQ